MSQNIHRISPFIWSAQQCERFIDWRIAVAFRCGLVPLNEPETTMDITITIPGFLALAAVALVMAAARFKR
jgi:hypothetical protein